MKSHPNTTVATGGSGAGLLLIFLLGRFGVHLTPEEGAAIVAAISSLILFVGRNGARGLLRKVWRGPK